VTTYLGRYRILKTLGEGGMGRVHLAEAAGPGGFVRRVVVKVARRNASAALHQALVDEAKTAAALVHKNIVPVLDFDEAGGERMVILEHVDGLDLAQLVDRGGPLPVPLVAFIGAEAAAALDYAHRRSLVHRDVSTANLMVSWEGEVKLTDFGVASLLRADDSAIRGNLSYMAPEQARGATVDGRADLFALGAVLWELVTGNPPFGASCTVEQARRRRLPPLPRDELSAIIGKAASVAPDDRYPSAAALREELLRLTTGMTDPGRALAVHLSQFKRKEEARRLDTSALGAAALGAGRPLTQVAPRGKPAQQSETATPSFDRRYIYFFGGAAVVGSLLGILLGTRHSSPKVTVIEPAAVVASPAPRAEAPKMGSISINAVPWAHIYIDGKSAGQTPRAHIALEPGPHTIRLTTGGRDERTRTVTIQPGHDSKLTVDFAKP
jgi:serine/threonine-protein kinase